MAGPVVFRAPVDGLWRVGRGPDALKTRRLEDKRRRLSSVGNRALIAMLPPVPLAEAVIMVDRETGFSACLAHAGGATPRDPPSCTNAISTVR